MPLKTSLPLNCRQGLIAGANAADPSTPVTFGREQAYLGVLVDDLVTQGTSEPYRMLSARAEFRLSLRPDNADLRLTRQGRELGLVQPDRWKEFDRHFQRVQQADELLQSLKMTCNAWQRQGIDVSQDGQHYTVAQVDRTNECIIPVWVIPCLV